MGTTPMSTTTLAITPEMRREISRVIGFAREDAGLNSLPESWVIRETAKQFTTRGQCPAIQAAGITTQAEGEALAAAVLEATS